jgi:hypothetical protein
MSYAAMSPHHSTWPSLRAGLFFALFTVLALGVSPGRLAAAAAPEKPQTASWAVIDAVTSLKLNAETLAGLGLEVTGLDASGHRTPHPLSVVPPEAPTFRAAGGPIGLHAVVAWDGFRGFEGSSLRHQGGFRFRGAAGALDLTGLELRPGKPSSALELVDAKGVALLTTADAQWLFDAGSGQLRYLNADVRILPALAKRLGDTRYAGMTIGVLDLDATLQTGLVPPEPPVGPDAPPPCGDWSGIVDVALDDMSNIGQAGIATVNGRSVVVVLPSANLKNVGTANVPWFSKFTNLSNPPYFDQHPFLVWQMARSSAGVLEPLGRSDLKHAFLTINSGCAPGACTNSNILGIGCSDVYSTGTNNSTGSLAPRNEVTASTGIWNHCGGIHTHFDTDGNCVQDFSGSGENAFTHGLKAAETDLQVAGASYYVEAFYIIRNDSNIFNSMGYRQVTPAKPSSTWTFNTVGPYAQGPAINAWVNPVTPGANANNQLVDTGEGRVQLAVKVTDVVGSPGRKRFAYALQNHDFDRRIRSFHVPFDTTHGIIENVAYNDGDGFAANNWTYTIDASGITWTVPDTPVTPPTPPAELDFATLVSFRFDSDQVAAPAEGSFAVADAGPAGSVNEIRMPTLAPATGTAVGDFYTLMPCRLLDTRTPEGGAAPIPSGTVREVNVVAGSCGVPANAMALAINVTEVSATTGGEIAVYSAGPPTGAATVSFNPELHRANNAIVLITSDGKLKVKPTLNGAGSTHVVLDIAGYFLPDAP